MYRPQWWADIANGRTVLQIALDVHMGLTGSSQTSNQSIADDFWLLTYVVENWKPTTHEAWRGFDTAVLNLILAALGECRECQVTDGSLKEAIFDSGRQLSAWAAKELSERRPDDLLKQ